MKLTEIEEIRACLPRGRTTFYYFKDLYALELLSYWVGHEGCSIREIRGSRFGRLLEKPTVAAALKAAGGGVLTRDHLYEAWSTRGRTYSLTLGEWGRDGSCHGPWDQTSRPGKNLVLQLNFCANHNRECERLMRSEYGSFRWECHPIAGGRHQTLAWARLDIDLAGGEALIEEIQSDWIKEAKYERDWIVRERNRLKSANEIDAWSERAYGGKHYWKDIMQYVNVVLAPHAAMWEEAMLWAAIWFLADELGIRKIYYNTWSTGNRIKGIGYDGPPKSIYSKLPERFCFELTQYGPRFLRQKWRRRLRGEWRNSLWYALKF